MEWELSSFEDDEGGRRGKDDCDRKMAEARCEKRGQGPDEGCGLLQIQVQRR